MPIFSMRRTLPVHGASALTSHIASNFDYLDVPKRAVRAKTSLEEISWDNWWDRDRRSEKIPRQSDNCSEVLVAGVGFEPTTFRL